MNTPAALLVEYYARQLAAPEGSLDECPARLLQEARGRVVVIADRGAAHLVR